MGKKLLRQPPANHAPRYDTLDPGIRHAVSVLRAAKIDTFASCEGGPDHVSPHAIVLFSGDDHAGERAVAACREAHLPIAELRRVWQPTRYGLSAPFWEIIFPPHVPYTHTKFLPK